jgi:hypothetical protein
VSRHIEGPAAFYSQVGCEDLDQGVSDIYMDTERHQAILQRAAGRTSAQPIHPIRRVFYTFNDEGYEIEIPRSLDLPQGGTAYLNADTPDEYLGDADFLLQGDPLTRRRRDANRIANSDARSTEYFRSLTIEGRVSIGSFPSDDMNGIMSASATFIRAEPPTTTGTSAELAEDYIVVERVVLALGGRSGGGDSHLTFEQRVCGATVGDFAGVTIWAADNPGVGIPTRWMIRMPTQ